MLNPDELVGLWSLDARFSPGAQTDTLIYFDRNGRGVFARLISHLLEGCVFEWALADGRLSTRTTSQFAELPDDLQPEGEAWDRDDELVTIAHEETGTGQRRVLRLRPDQLLGEDAFAFLGLDPLPWIRAQLDSIGPDS